MALGDNKTTSFPYSKYTYSAPTELIRAWKNKQNFLVVPAAQDIMLARVVQTDMELSTQMLTMVWRYISASR